MSMSVTINKPVVYLLGRTVRNERTELNTVQQYIDRPDDVVLAMRKLLCDGIELYAMLCALILLDDKNLSDEIRPMVTSCDYATLLGADAQVVGASLVRVGDTNPYLGPSKFTALGNSVTLAYASSNTALITTPDGKTYASVTATDTLLNVDWTSLNIKGALDLPSPYGEGTEVILRTPPTYPYEGVAARLSKDPKTVECLVRTGLETQFFNTNNARAKVAAAVLALVRYIDKGYNE